MNRNLLIPWSFSILFLTISLAACTQDNEPMARDWTNHEPLNIDDSLAVVSIYKALDFQDWRYDGTDSVKKAMITVDLEDYNTWHFFKLEKQYGGREELIVSGIDINSEKLPEGFFPDGFRFPIEFGLLQNLTDVRINLVSEPDKEYSNSVDFPVRLFNNPIETLEISGDRFGGAIPAEIGKLENTLRNLKISHTNYSYIPEEMAKLINLRDEADLSFNQFSGKVPYFPPGHPLRYCILSWNQYTVMNWDYFRDNAERGGYLNPSQKCPYIYKNPLSGMIPEDVMDTKWWQAHHLSICTFNSWPAGFDNCRYCPILSSKK